MCGMGGKCGGGSGGCGPGGGRNLKGTWEKAIEYASVPVHGTLSRRLRKGVRLQINEGPVYDDAVFFLGEEFVRITVQGGDGSSANSYHDWSRIGSIRTFSAAQP